MDILLKYGAQATIVFPVVKRGVVDLAVSADWTPATGDTKISKDGGNVANTTNNPAAVGGTGSALWSLTLTATEMQAARVVVQIVDSATKAIEDQVILIATYGNASAQHAFDLSSATVTPGANSITSSVIAANAIGASQVADGAIDAGAIATGAITNAKFAAGAIDAAAVADGAIDAGAIATGAITNAKFAAGAIDATAIAADAIGASELAADAVAEIADGIWDEALAGHAGAGTAGKRVTDTGTAVDTNLDVKVSTRGTGNANAGDAMALTAAAVDAVWDEAQSGHTTAGTFGKYLDAPVSGATPPTAAAVADAVWDEARAGHVGAGTFGAAIDTNVGSRAAPGDAMTLAAGAVDAAAIATDAIDADAIAASAVTEIQSGLATSAAVAGVQADTDDIQTRLPAALVGGRINASVGAMAANVITATAIQDGALTAAKAATGFFDAVWTRALASMTTPANLRTPYGMVCKLVNKVGVAAGVLTVYEPDDVTAVGTQTVTSDAAAEPITGLDTV